MIGEQASPSTGAIGSGAKAPKAGSRNSGVASASGEQIRPVSFSVRLTGEAISVIAMALATLALGSGLYLHAGFDPSFAAATAVAAYVCMLAAHAMVPRFFSVETYGSEHQGEYEAAVQGASSAGVAAATKGPMNNAVASPREAIATAPPPGAKPSQRPPAEATAALKEATSSSPGPQPSTPPVRPVSDAAATNSAQKATPSSLPAAEPATRSQAVKPPVSDVRSAPSKEAQRVPQMSPAPREADVEMIQGLIKKLADEVNAASVAPATNRDAAEKVSERAISQSVDALKATAGTMRERDAAAAARNGVSRPKSAGDERTETGRPAAVNAKLSQLAEALATGRVEVLLDPILDFDSSRPKHFEIFVRLRDEAGKVLNTDTIGRDLQGTGMLSRLDGARVAHASQIAMRFAGSGRAAHVFSTVSGEALTANKFLDGVAHAYRERDSFAGQLVMTFSQDDVRGFGAREWQTLAEFARLGFRYGIADVDSLDMDFEALREKGFDFVKLDADVFLKGLPAGNDVFIPASDICKHMARLGLSVIVGHIEDREVAAKVFGFGVLLGQGTLFGGAKAVKREILSARGPAAA